MNAKNIFKKVWNVLGWFVMIALVIGLIYSIAGVWQARQTGEDFYLMNYRPGVILTGSMDPEIVEGGLTIGKKLKSIDELKTGDIITFHIYDEGIRQNIKITHRIIDIKGEQIFTKGDNNQVADNFVVTMDNAESKIVAVFNGFAAIHARWISGINGKIICLCPLIFLFLLSMFLDQIATIKKENKELLERDKFKENVISALGKDNLNSTSEDKDTTDTTENKDDEDSIE
ncbi:MAG: signal peptidase I [Oscillospiraceae bacterium]